MGKVNRTQFKADAVRGKGAKFSDWKDAGKTTGWLHPKIGLWEKWGHGAIPSNEEDDSGKQQFRRRRCNCIGQAKSEIPNAGCPMCQLQEFASQKIDEGFNDGEVILEGGTSRKDRIVLDLNDLAGKGDFRTNPKVRSEVCFCWIEQPKEEGSSPKEMVSIITGPHSLGERILEVIDEQSEARGELSGDCEIPEGFELISKKGKLFLTDGEQDIEWSPYAFKLKYNPDAQPATMYSALKQDADICPITDDVRATMLCGEKELEVDMKALCGSTDVDKQMSYIKSSWESNSIPFEEFEDFFYSRSGLKKGKKKKSEEEPKSSKKTQKDEEEEEEPKASKKTRKDDEDERPGKKFKCPDCGEMVVPQPRTGRCPECGEKIPETDVPR